VNRTCIVVADAGTARFFGVESVDSPRDTIRLVERTALTNPDLKTLGESASGRVHTETNINRQAGPLHPMGAQRERHRMELNRRFGNEIAVQAGEMTKGWKNGTVVLVAAPQLLGLMRENMLDALGPGIELKELAKDYVNLTLGEIRDHLAQNILIPLWRKDAAAG
jgi:protein required for attachment to host cells